jgi:hypothetical protein
MKRIFACAALVASMLPALARPNSGLAIGDKTPAHNPQHITGPDAGTHTCPV